MKSSNVVNFLDIKAKKEQDAFDQFLDDYDFDEVILSNDRLSEYNLSDFLSSFIPFEEDNVIHLDFNRN